MGRIAQILFEVFDIKGKIAVQMADAVKADDGKSHQNGNGDGGSGHQHDDQQFGEYGVQ